MVLCSQELIDKIHLSALNLYFTPAYSSPSPKQVYYVTIQNIFVDLNSGDIGKTFEKVLWRTQLETFTVKIQVQWIYQIGKTDFINVLFFLWITRFDHLKITCILMIMVLFFLSFSWTRNGTHFDIENDPNVDMKPQSGTLVVDISRERVEHYEGVYQCTARNKHGTAVSHNIVVRQSSECSLLYHLFKITSLSSFIVSCASYEKNHLLSSLFLTIKLQFPS